MLGQTYSLLSFGVLQVSVSNYSEAKSSMDAYVDYLPFDIQIEIARYLPLKDALAYADVCTLAHDAVYYVFSHRKELNFTSLLDDSGCIALPDTMILYILHAHVRAETVVLHFHVLFPCLQNLNFTLLCTGGSSSVRIMSE